MQARGVFCFLGLLPVNHCSNRQNSRLTVLSLSIILGLKVKVPDWKVHRYTSLADVLIRTMHDLNWYCRILRVVWVKVNWLNTLNQMVCGIQSKLSISQWHLINVLAPDWSIFHLSPLLLAVSLLCPVSSAGYIGGHLVCVLENTNESDITQTIVSFWTKTTMASLPSPLQTQWNERNPLFCFCNAILFPVILFQISLKGEIIQMLWTCQKIHISNLKDCVFSEDFAHLTFTHINKWNCV